MIKYAPCIFHAMESTYPKKCSPSSIRRSSLWSLCRHGSDCSSDLCQEATFFSLEWIRAYHLSPAQAIINMDVTEENFDIAFQVLKEFLHAATFIAIDLEFTGLGLEQPSQLDTPQIRYELARAGAEKYPPCQFGVTLFRPAPALPYDRDYNDRLAQWESMPFNFNLCLRPIFKNTSSRFALKDPEFSIQASCAAFLFENGFSFDKMFADGISWLRKDEEERVSKSICHIPDHSSSRTDHLHLSVEDEAIISDLRQQISRWISHNGIVHRPTSVAANCTIDLETDSDSTALTESATAVSTQPSSLGQRPVLLVHQPTTPKCRRAFYGMIRNEFPTLSASAVPDQCGGMQVRLVHMDSAKDAKIQNEATREREMRLSNETRMKSYVGFRHVIDLLVEARKPIIAHNCLHDLCKIYANFISPLPSSLSDFKRNLHSLFPLIVDTKVLVGTVAKERKWLSELLQTNFDKGLNALDGLSRSIEKACAERSLPTVSLRSYVNPKNALDNLNWEFRGYQGLNAERCRHEAGYDALVTGHLFLQLVSLLQGKSFVGAELELSMRRDASIDPLLNRVFLASCGGYSAINLDADDPEADEVNAYFDRCDVLVVAGFCRARDIDIAKSTYPREYRFANRDDMYRLASLAVKGTSFVVDSSASVPVDRDRMLLVLRQAAKDSTPDLSAEAENKEADTGYNEDIRKAARKREASHFAEALGHRDKNVRGQSSDLSKVFDAIRSHGLCAGTYSEALSERFMKRCRR